MGSNPVQSLNFLGVIFPVVLRLHSHLPFFHYLIAAVGHLLPLEIVFDDISKHLEFRHKYSATRGFFTPLFGVWKCGQTRHFVKVYKSRNFVFDFVE